MMASQPKLSDAEVLAARVADGDRRALAKAITLCESENPAHRAAAEAVLSHCTPTKAQRIGITGMPGAGKSTLIDSVGMTLIDQGHKVAVLAVDPSSTISMGSILGDKTRMHNLSVQEHAFIRPSPSRGGLGGVARRTMETILLCELAGFDRIIVETVGVGQSEVTVARMVDVFVSLQIPGAGDELQGIKKGIVEQADLLVITKNDGALKLAAKTARQQLINAFHYRPEGQTPVLLVSTLEGTGLNELLSTIDGFIEERRQDGRFAAKRQEQRLHWLTDEISAGCLTRIFHHPSLTARYEELAVQVGDGRAVASIAARQLLDLIFPPRP